MNSSNSSNATNATNATAPVLVDTGLDDNSTSPPEFAQIKLLGNNDGRTIMTSTADYEKCAGENEDCTCSDNGPRTIKYGAKGSYTYNEADDSGVTVCSNALPGGDPIGGVAKNCFCLVNSDITATISTHLNLKKHSSPKRPRGNKRRNGAKFAFVQDNGDDKQKWKKQRHPSQPADTFRLIDQTNHCLVANNPNDFKRTKSSAYVVSKYRQKGPCTFWTLEQAGNAWNIVMARQGLSAEKGKYAYMNGWGLAVLGWKKDNELGPGKIYLVLKKNQNKFSIFSSAIF